MLLSEVWIHEGTGEHFKLAKEVHNQFSCEGGQTTLS